MPASILARLAFDRNRILRKDRRGVEKRAMVLAAVEAVTNSDPIRPPRSDEPNVAAEATSGETVHSAGSRVRLAFQFDEAAERQAVRPERAARRQRFAEILQVDRVERCPLV